MAGRVGPDVDEPHGADGGRDVPPEEPESVPRARTRRWLVAAGVVVAVGAVGLAVALGRSPGDPDAAPSTSPSATAEPSEAPADEASPGAEVEEPVEAPAEGPGEPGDDGAAPGDPDLTEADALLDALLGPDPALPPVGLDDAAEHPGGVTVALGAVEPVETGADGPGEVAGPGVRLTVLLTNGGDEPVALDAVVVNAYAGAEHAPAEPTLSETTPFAGRLEPGAEATGVYVFRLPGGADDELHVTVSHDPAAPTAVFTARASAVG